MEKKLSLPAAILINLNIMMGAGIFINTVELAKRAGFLGSFMYPLIGLLILPLMVTITQLIKLYPSGGFYVFAAQELHPFIGFISAWSYFIAKLASASLLIHVSVSLITQIFPALLSISSILGYDLLILTLFIALNLLNMQTGSRIQFGFLGLKLIPVLFVIGAGIAFFAPTSLATLPVVWAGIPISLPLVLYATMGFEAICAISNKIKDPERNAPKSIMISFMIMMSLIFLFQFLFYSLLGTTLSDQTTYQGAFPALLHALFDNQFLIQKLQTLFNVAIAASALGGCYGVLYSNNWNLYILAQHQAIRASQFFTALNSQAIPYVCLFVEWLLCALYLTTTAGNQLILQQLAALGTALTYTICVIVLWRAYRRQQQPVSRLLIPAAALMSCLILISACIRNFALGGILPLLCFSGLLIVGLVMYHKK